MKYLAKMTVFTVVLLLLLVPMARAQEPANAIEQNTSIAVQSIEMLWNANNPDSIPNYFTPTFQIHTPVYRQSTMVSNTRPEGYYAAILEDYHRAFPDLVMTIDHVAAEGDMVFLHISAEGTFSGNFTTPLGHTVAPTGNHMSWQDVYVYRFEDGKIAEWWGYSLLPFFGFDQHLDWFE